MLRAQSFQDLVKSLHKSTRDNANEVPITLTQKFKDAVGDTVKNFKENIAVKELVNLEFDVTETGRKMNLANVKKVADFQFHPEDKHNPNINIPTILNWFNKIVKSLVDKVQENAHVIKNFGQHLSNLMEKSETINGENNNLKDKNDEIEKKHEELLQKHTKIVDEVVELRKINAKIVDDVDELRQRNMKGNLIVSSPDLPNNPTLMKKFDETDSSTGASGLESDLTMVLRLIKRKTGVAFDPKEVVAFHPVGKKNTSYLVRIANRAPGSNWESLTAGMARGKMPGGEQNFTKDNIFVNYQLTDFRGKLAFQIRNAKKKMRGLKYAINDNGVIKVRKSDNDSWIPVKDQITLEQIIGIQNLGDQ